jgi:hypothetical protein
MAPRGDFNSRKNHDPNDNENQIAISADATTIFEELSKIIVNDKLGSPVLFLLLNR